MPGPMEGIRVVELWFGVAGPSVVGVLADWRRLGVPLPR